MPPVVSIVGKSKSGKTTLIEKLIRELKSRGYGVATIKHSPQESDFDEPGKDSWRHIQAGSDTTAVSSPDKVVMIKPIAQEATIDEVVNLLGEDYDIILAEGFKRGSTPKIEVHRKDSGALIAAIRRRRRHGDFGKGDLRPSATGKVDVALHGPTEILEGEHVDVIGSPTRVEQEAGDE
jgi:molybdopterin-guanine dinucleotide biosynthesis protein MobB